MKFILDSYFSIPYTIKKEMGFLPSKTLWFERVARFFFYVHNIIKIHFPVCIMPDQHRRMEHIIPFHFPIIAVHRQCKMGIISVPPIGGIPAVFFSHILPEMFSSCNLKHLWYSL